MIETTYITFLWTSSQDPEQQYMVIPTDDPMYGREGNYDYDTLLVRAVEHYTAHGNASGIIRYRNHYCFRVRMYGEQVKYIDDLFKDVATEDMHNLVLTLNTFIEEKHKAGDVAWLSDFMDVFYIAIATSPRNYVIGPDDTY